jgi:hypothetical protein
MVPPAHLAPVLDLARIPVGNMANIVKAAKRAGHPPHTTIDTMVFASHAAPHVEPGRLEVRVAEFYRTLEGILHPELAKAAEDSRRHAERDSRYGVSDGRREGSDRRRDGEEGGERYVPGYDEERERRGDDQEWDRPRPRKIGRYSAPDGAGTSAQISEDNVGHKLLRGLGWQQGSGLGAEGGGIVEPISAKQMSDRAGIGSGDTTELPTLKDGSIDYAAYRKQLSSQYHSKILDSLK